MIFEFNEMKRMQETQYDPYFEGLVHLSWNKIGYAI